MQIDKKTWISVTTIASVIVGWVWLTNYFTTTKEFGAFAGQVQVQQSKAAKALIMLELRFAQEQLRQAKLAHDEGEIIRWENEIKKIEITLESLKNE